MIIRLSTFNKLFHALKIYLSKKLIKESHVQPLPLASNILFFLLREHFTQSMREQNCTFPFENVKSTYQRWQRSGDR